MPSTTVVPLGSAEAAAVIVALKEGHGFGQVVELIACPAGSADDWKTVAPELFPSAGSADLVMEYVAVGDGGLHCNLGSPGSPATDTQLFASLEVDAVDHDRIDDLRRRAAESAAIPVWGGQLFVKGPGQAFWFDAQLTILLETGRFGELDPHDTLQRLVPVVVARLAVADPATLRKPAV